MRTTARTTAGTTAGTRASAAAAARAAPTAAGGSRFRRSGGGGNERCGVAGAAE